MAGWGDVLEKAQPSLCSVALSATQGDDWKWVFFVSDNAGTALPWLTLSATGEAQLWSTPNSGGSLGASEVAPGTLAVAFGDDGSVTLTATAAATADVGGSEAGPVILYPACKITVDGQTVNLFNAADSTLKIRSL